MFLSEYAATVPTELYMPAQMHTHAFTSFAQAHGHTGKRVSPPMHHIISYARMQVPSGKRPSALATHSMSAR